jgi:hypothetical protein
VKLLISTLLPFLFISCANLAADRWDEVEEQENKTQGDKAERSDKTIKTLEDVIPISEAGDKLQLLDPDTTSELMKDENKKTVSGPTSMKVVAPESDSVIDVKPSSTAPAE